MPQILTVSLAGIVYTLTLFWRNAVAGGGWLLDIGDASNNPIVRGIPLVTGADLLAQYEYLGIGVQLFVQTNGDPNAVPTFTNLGSQANLFFTPLPS